MKDYNIKKDGKNVTRKGFFFLKKKNEKQSNH